jgi:membrane-associated protein
MHLHDLLDLILHADKTLNHWATVMGGGVYVLLFAIIFCETGLVVTPFLPGDSLLFAVGALAATADSPISLPVMAVTLCAAAILGNIVNYSIGKRVGPRVFNSETSWLLNKRHLMQAHEFYEKYGGKAIVLARFVPIVRTFAPFVAGIGQMTYTRYMLYNVLGSVPWVLLFLMGGWAFGNVAWVQKHFGIVEIAIILISLAPIAIEYIRARRHGQPPRDAAVSAIVEPE